MIALAPPTVNEAEARAIMSSGLGKAELKFVMSLTVPLFWVIRDSDGKFQARNGSAFFLNAGQGPFGVTASHVLKGLSADRAAHNVVAVQIGDLPFDPDAKNAIIASDDQIDIATFRIADKEIRELGKTALTGFQHRWPPLPPLQDRGVYFGGFPGVETVWASPREISFGAAPAGGVASSISERDVSSLVNRANLIPLLGAGIPAENYDFGGMSGGPMLTVVEQNGLRSWSLAGVIYQGPNTSLDINKAIAGLEIFKARRAHFILPDGTLDVARWQSLAFVPSYPLTE